MVQKFGERLLCVVNLHWERGLYPHFREICVTFNILGAMRKFICFMLTLLGFGAVVGCGEDPVSAYGAPHVEFRVSARVVDEAGKPIKGIALMSADMGSYSIAVSSSEGVIEAAAIRSRVPRELRFVDIDGMENGGEFKTLSLDVTDEFELIEEGEGWKEGT